MLPIYIKRECSNGKDTHDLIPHFHNNIELIYVLKGTMECQTNNTVFSLNKGDICFINNNQLHHLYPDKEMSNHIALIIDNDLFTRNKEIYNDLILPVLDDMSFSHIKYSSTDGSSVKIQKLILDLEKLMDKKECGYELEAISIIHMIFKHLYNTYKNKKTNTIVDENIFIMEKIIKYIQNNYDKDLTIDNISKSGNISPSKCFRLFRKYTRMSPINYLNSYRLDIGAEKLISTSDTVTNIALSCGFNEPSYFNRLFLREFGITPLEYRKKNNN